MNKRSIVLHLRDFDYGELINYAKEIHDGVQRLSALFPTPVPTLVVFQNAINEMKDARDKWGERGSMGGSPQKQNLLKKREVVREYLRSYANYVMVTQPDNFQSWLDVGFTLKGLPSKTGTMQAVQNLHQFIARDIPQGQIKLKWERPLGAPKSTVITYVVLRSDDNEFRKAIQAGTSVNKAVFIDTPPKAAVYYFYWVIPYTTAGEGVRSEICRAFATPK